MIVLVGSTSCGKTTLAKYLKSAEGFVHVLEQTTRTMRPGEVNGEDYWYVDDENYDFQYMNDELVGSMTFSRYQNGENQRVRYGTRKSQIELAGSKSVLVTNPGAAKLIKDYNKHNKGQYEIFIVYVKIDEEEQRRRLAARNDDPNEITKRIKTDTEALAGFEDFADYVVDNSYSSPGCVAEEIKQAYMKFLEEERKKKRPVLL